MTNSINFSYGLKTTVTVMFSDHNFL